MDPSPVTPYKISLAAITMGFVEQAVELRSTYNSAKQAQEKMSAASELLEQVEKHLAQDQIDNAISLLRHSVHENKDLPPAPWLILFDLYRQTDRRSAYDSLMVIFERRFNRTMIDWATYDSNDYQIGLDEMPELMDRIWQYWGTPEGISFLQLLCNNPLAPNEIFFNRGLARDAINLAKILPLQGEE
jgi:hypothetical protein